KEGVGAGDGLPHAGDGELEAVGLGSGETFHGLLHDGRHLLHAPPDEVGFHGGSPAELTAHEPGEAGDECAGGHLGDAGEELGGLDDEDGEPADEGGGGSAAGHAIESFVEGEVGGCVPVSAEGGKIYPAAE